jgi:branched-chain amino acid transport system substrate-binding protein
MVRSKWIVVTALVGAGVLALSACSSGGSGSGSSAGGADKTLHFAVIAEATGALAAYGTQLEAGVKAAVKDVNASSKYKVKLDPKFYDCQSDQAVCAQLTRQAVTSDGATAVIGPVVSTDIQAAVAVTQPLNVPHLGMAVFNQLTDNYTNTFRWSTQSDISNQTVINYVKATMKPGDTIAIVNSTNDFGKGGATQQTADLKAVGITPVASISHDPGQPDYTPEITQLKAANPTYVLLSDSVPGDIALQLKEAKSAGLKSIWIGADAAGTIQLAGDAAKGYLTVSPWFPTDATKTLSSKFEAQGIQTPGWISAMAYDATLGLAEAASTKGTSSKEITAGLESLNNFSGLARTGWSFTAKDHRGLGSSQIANWNGTAYEVVWPKS